MATTVTKPAAPTNDEAAWHTRRARLASPVGAGVAALAAAVTLHLRDPHVQGSWGVCPTALLGFDCPACGSLRAVYHLTNADFLAAASSNLLLVLFAPVALVLWLRRVRGAWLGGSAYKPLSVPTAVWVLAIAAALIFTVARNLSLGAWLHS